MRNFVDYMYNSTSIISCPVLIARNFEINYLYINIYIRFLCKDSQVLCYKKFVKNSTDLLVSY